MNEEEIAQKKREDIMLSQMMGNAMMATINLILLRWEEQGRLKGNKVRIYKITVEIAESVPKENHTENNKNAMYL